MNMDDKDQHREFRNKLVSFVKEDLVGPSEPTEIIKDSPTWRYATGMLFPQEDLDSSATSTIGTEDEPDNEYAEEDLGASMERTSSYFPSAMGISFLLKAGVAHVSVKVEAGRYVPMNPDKPEDVAQVYRLISDIPESLSSDLLFQEKMTYSEGRLSLKASFTKAERDILVNRCADHKAAISVIYTLYDLVTNGWRREQIDSTVDIDLSAKKPILIDECLNLVVTTKAAGRELKICTVALVNTAKAAKPQSDQASSRFQVSLKITPSSGEHFIDFAESNTLPIGDKEEESLSLLYRKRRTFAAGHGCSADWKITDNGETSDQIWTETTPSYEIPQMVFSLPPNPDIEKPDLRMVLMAYGDDDEIIASLRRLSAQYDFWIGEIESDSRKLPADMKSTAARHIADCRDASSRIMKGIDLLEKDAASMRAFKLSNQAMVMQRCQSRIQTDKRFPDDEQRKAEEYTTATDEWRPFQIAFLLLNLVSIADPESEERAIVDLIWFPTGGGKTEAYLGLTAFTIFSRRMKNAQDVSGGTTVIMRYTLRLLASQQFQRACTLICACELIRKNAGDLGKEEIGIGLWVGSGSTPNSIKEAEYRIREMRNQHSGAANNPFQVLSCPWCGTHMARRDGRGVNCYEIKSKPRKHLGMWCPNSSCDFSSGLPVKVVDEDIYNEPPTLLFGTVDKFANMPWLQGASSIFALDEGNANPSPELIIQDELHLISGALGTVVGIYESALDMLCSQKNTKTKIIASTATVRRAKEQCKALYARELKQFPPPGLDASDSFFARESDISKQSPGRLYMGVMPAGKTSTTMQVRLMADCIQGVKLIEADDKIKDPFWTQVVYCNSIRELGKSKTITYDDVQEHSQTLCQRLGKQHQQRYYRDKAVQELTSRIPAEEIPEILQRLFIGLPDKDKTIDILLATNMISVGVDVSRLGLMTIIGQPKTTAEYIQASSRVGRASPGIVFTLLSSVKSRDRSHYEQFRKYHQSIYRHVEPTSVTPFSPPARDKALHAVLITIIRHVLGHRKNDDLKNFNVDSEEAERVIKMLMERVSTVEEDRDEIEATEKDIRRILGEIDEIVHREGGATYGSRQIPEKNALMRSAESDRGGKYPTLSSMRSTDSECNIYIKGVLPDKDSSRRPSLRRSQCITTFGVGAIADLASGSVMMMGIDEWPTRPCRKLVDDRLEKKLHAAFFLMPPDKEDSDDGIPAVRFPRWMRCRKCKSLRDIDDWRNRWNRKGEFDSQPKCDTCYLPLIPSRFIVACPHGHINDFPYVEWVHRKKKDCPKPELEYLKTGSTAALSGIYIRCKTCKERQHMGDAFNKEILASMFKCKGGMPWMGRWESPCEEAPVTLQRGATNVHFPITRSSILIPPYSSDSLKSRICSTVIWERYETGLNLVGNGDEEIRDFAKAISYELGDDVSEIFDTLKSLMRNEVQQKKDSKDDEEEYRYPEFMAFKGNYKREDCDERDFLIDTREASKYAVPGIAGVVLVKKLKETRVQTGFTRIKPYAGAEEGEDATPVKEVSVKSDPRIRWLPGYEVRGEGIFIELAPGIIEQWSANKTVQKRISVLQQRFADKPDKMGKTKEISPAFILLHTLSHILIRQLSFECGYSSSSLSERIYCSSSGRKDRKMYGILIYTAQGDSDGTMGGLVRQAEPHLFTRTFYEAIRSAQWCSSDPLCIGCMGQGFNAMSLGACHACAMLPETSCEVMNRYLDRGTLIGTPEDSSLGFFSEWCQRISREGKI